MFCCPSKLVFVINVSYYSILVLSTWDGYAGNGLQDFICSIELFKKIIICHMKYTEEKSWYVKIML